MRILFLTVALLVNSPAAPTPPKESKPTPPKVTPSQPAACADASKLMNSCGSLSDRADSDYCCSNVKAFLNGCSVDSFLDRTLLEAARIQCMIFH